MSELVHLLDVPHASNCSPPPPPPRGVFTTSSLSYLTTSRVTHRVSAALLFWHIIANCVRLQDGQSDTHLKAGGLTSVKSEIN